MSALAWRPRVMSPWGHLACWLIAVLAAAALVTSGVVGLVLVSDLSEHVPARLTPDRAVYVAAGAVILLVAVFGIWIRYWFLPADLIHLIDTEHGSVVEQHGRVRKSVKARIRDLWLLADLDHPVLSYWPAHAVRYGRGGPGARRGLHPRHMSSVSRVELVRVGDFSALPEARFQVTSETLRRTSSPSGFPVLDEALRDAAPALDGMSAPVTVEIRPQWLRVRVRGGSWLGARFARRIRPTVAFTERLVAALDDRFVPEDPDATHVVLDAGELRLLQDTRYQTIHLDPAQAAADDQNHRV